MIAKLEEAEPDTNAGLPKPMFSTLVCSEPTLCSNINAGGKGTLGEHRGRRRAGDSFRSFPCMAPLGGLYNGSSLCGKGWEEGCAMGTR